MKEEHFYTLRGYQMKEEAKLSTAMEDYLEMICRLDRQGESLRVNQLATMLNVKPSSSSKMVNELKDGGLVNFEPYGIIRLTEQGKELGGYLLYRHQVLERFFCLVNSTKQELDLVEKIEHFIDSRTVNNIEKLLNQIADQSL